MWAGGIHARAARPASLCVLFLGKVNSSGWPGSPDTAHGMYEVGLGNVKSSLGKIMSWSCWRRQFNKICAYFEPKQFSCSNDRRAFAFPNQNCHNLLSFDSIHFGLFVSCHVCVSFTGMLSLILMRMEGIILCNLHLLNKWCFYTIAWKGISKWRIFCIFSRVIWGKIKLTEMQDEVFRVLL